MSILEAKFLQLMLPLIRRESQRILKRIIRRKDIRNQIIDIIWLMILQRLNNISHSFFLQFLSKEVSLILSLLDLILTES